ncbi:ras-like GTP-binding protein rhoA [Anneissia japonica]|uniref:ras-like GTP-binding protein rhoA n=1 Tax=Anneissia japonica TaxID=1529436 RepID=UPI0014256941|nr:ras-like GTP-binding protein rhoA [Anneissia japonica]
MIRRQSMMSLAERTRCRIVIVGDSGCGKSSLLGLFVKDAFPEIYIPTTFEQYESTIDVGKIHLEVNIWDTSGKHEYDNVRHLAYPDTTAAIICYDISRPDTLKSVIEKWQPEIQKHCSNSPIILTGCKSDLRNNVQILSELGTMKKMPVSHDRGTKVARQIGAAAFVECSAKTNLHSVREVFENAALASIGKLSLQKSYMDLPSVGRKLSIRQSFRRRKDGFQSPVRVKTTVVKAEKGKMCVVM